MKQPFFFKTYRTRPFFPEKKLPRGVDRRQESSPRYPRKVGERGDFSNLRGLNSMVKEGKCRDVGVSSSPHAAEPSGRVIVHFSMCV